MADGISVYGQGAWASDLAAYLNAARRLGEDGSLYSQALISGSFEPGPPDLYFYAPPLGVAMLPFTEMPITQSSAIWWAIRVGAALLACALMPVRPVLRALAFGVVAFSLPGLKDPILGNVSLLLLLPMVLGWRYLDRPIGSIALALSIPVRPSLGLFLVWQVLRRQWRAVLWICATGAALILMTLPFVGMQGYVDYLAVLGNIGVPTGPSENRDLGALALSLGAGEWLVSAARLVSILLAALAVVASLRREPEIGYVVVLCASLLVVPLLWDHYLATLVVPAAFLAHRLWVPLILLPLLSWLPIAAPFLIIVVMLLPFLVRRPPDMAGITPRTVPQASAT